MKDSLSEADSREAQLEAETPHRWSLTGGSLTGRWWRNFMSRGPIRSIHYKLPKDSAISLDIQKTFLELRRKNKTADRQQKEKKKDHELAPYSSSGVFQVSGSPEIQI